MFYCARYVSLIVLFSTLFACSNVCTTQLPRKGELTSNALVGTWKNNTVESYYVVDEDGSANLYVCDPSGSFRKKSSFRGVIVNDQLIHQYEGHCPKTASLTLNNGQLDLAYENYHVSVSRLNSIPAACDETALAIRSVTPGELIAGRSQSVIIHYAVNVVNEKEPLYLMAGYTSGTDGSYVLDNKKISLANGRHDGELRLQLTPKKYSNVPFEIYLRLMAGGDDVNKNLILLSRKVVNVK